MYVLTNESGPKIESDNFSRFCIPLASCLDTPPITSINEAICFEQCRFEISSGEETD